MTPTPTRETHPAEYRSIALEIAGALTEALTHPLSPTDHRTLAHVRASELESAAKFDAGDTDALGGVTVSYPPIVAVAVALAEALTYPLEPDHRATLENMFENTFEALQGEPEIVPDHVNGGAMIARDLDGAVIWNHADEDAFAAEVATRRAVVGAEVATLRDALTAKVARIRAAEAAA